ncbi:MAG: trehalose-phosphatase [Terracidiphilus sp.]
MRQDLKQIELEKLETFFYSVQCSQAPLLLLDYDGTLADFRINRFEARPWAGVRELLAIIQKDMRTRLTVITGRPASEINPMLQLPKPVDVWGLHGAERLLVDGRRELQEAPEEARAKLEELRQRLGRDAFGGLFEDKPNAVVMHWRGHTQRQAKLIEQKTLALFEPASLVSGLSLLPFEAGVELRAGRDKGGAVQAIVEQAEPDTPVTYLGDDLTDESAFCAINQTRNPHLSVLMRREWRETAAEVWLQPPDQLRWFLRQWEMALSGSGTPALRAAEPTETRLGV